MKRITYEEAEKKFCEGKDIDCDGVYSYKMNSDDIKREYVLREIQVEEFFNIMESRIEDLKENKKLSLLKLGYEEALRIFVNGK